MYLSINVKYESYNIIAGYKEADKVYYTCYYRRGHKELQLTDSYREFWL